MRRRLKGGEEEVRFIRGSGCEVSEIKIRQTFLDQDSPWRLIYFLASEKSEKGWAKKNTKNIMGARESLKIRESVTDKETKKEATRNSEGWNRSDGRAQSRRWKRRKEKWVFECQKLLLLFLFFHTSLVQKKKKCRHVASIQKKLLLGAMDTLCNKRYYSTTVASSIRWNIIFFFIIIIEKKFIKNSTDLISKANIQFLLTVSGFK